MFLIAGPLLHDTSRLRSVSGFGGAIDIGKGNAFLTSDPSAVFELRGECWLHSRSPRSLAADFAPRRCHFHEVALLNASLNLQTTNTQSSRLRKHDVFAPSGFVGPAEYAQNHTRAIFLHLHRRHINIQCADRVQAFDLTHFADGRAVRRVAVGRCWANQQAGEPARQVAQRGDGSHDALHVRDGRSRLSVAT